MLAATVTLIFTSQLAMPGQSAHCLLCQVGSEAAKIPYAEIVILCTSTQQNKVFNFFTKYFVMLVVFFSERDGVSVT
jgi:hypothetical protein